MTVKGLVEFAGTSYVSGWAYDSESPSVRLEITVRVGDEFCASDYAQIERHDLLMAGIGDGKHGFSIDLRAMQISAEDASIVEVHAISGAEVIKLPRTRSTPEDIVDLTSNPFEPTSDETQLPLFILGPARSGTSVITLALLESASYVGTGEGHLLPLAHALVSAIDRYYQRHAHDPNTMLGRVPIDAFQKLIRRSFVKLSADLFPTARWLDKTPTVEMVRASVLMKEIWPNARFIFMKRRVIENVLSRLRRFPRRFHRAPLLRLGGCHDGMACRARYAGGCGTGDRTPAARSRPGCRGRLDCEFPAATGSCRGAVSPLCQQKPPRADGRKLWSDLLLGSPRPRRERCATDEGDVRSDHAGPRLQLRWLLLRRRGWTTPLKNGMNSCEDTGPVENQPPQASITMGRVETVSTDFVIGWASVSAANHFSHVFSHDRYRGHWIRCREY